MARKDDAEILGVKFDTSEPNQPKVDSDNSLYYIPFYKGKEFFENYESYIAFIKACESLVRKHSFYKQYKKYLIEIVGMNTCQVLPNIEADLTDGNRKVTVEMHHGPILTLFDTCQIVLNYLINTGAKDITTFKVANIVIEEHRLNNVRVMLLSKSVHQKIDDDQIMLNYNMGFGDTATFLRKYHEGLDKTIIRNINAYIEWSKANDSFDNHVFEISQDMEHWGNNDYDDFESLNLTY